MIPLHCLWLNRKIERVVILKMTWFYFFSYFYLILLIQMLCGCCSIVCLRLQVMQAKQVDCKISTKINFFFRKTFRDTFGQLQTREYKPTKKWIVRL